MNENDALHPIALLVDELRSDDLTLRLNSIKRLSMIALALGPERTRVDLLSFLHDSLDDDDEILLALAGELDVSFVEYVGGNEYAHVLFEPLEALAGMEETLVRDRAAESIAHIARVLSVDQILTKYLPMLQRLAHGEWFASRVSAAQLYVPAYEKLTKATNLPEAPGILNDLCVSFRQLSQDDTPMVRRAATKALGPLASAMPYDHITQVIVPILKKLAVDEQDSVRLLVVESLASVTNLLGDTPNQIDAIFGDIIKILADDEAWRVRYMMADKISDIARASIKSPNLFAQLIPLYIKLLQDPEAEVRTAAANHLPDVASITDAPVIVDQLVPVAHSLTADESQHVRTALASNVPALAPLVGQRDSQEYLVPIFLQLLKDEFPDVRLSIISKLDKVHSVVGVSVLSQALLPAILELAEDKQWRVRQAIMDHIPPLAEQLGPQNFSQQLGSLSIHWLQDPVFAVRDAACINLEKLVHIFGVSWAKSFVIPRITELAASPVYLTRITTLFAIAALAPALDQDTITSLISSIVLPFRSDTVPNIRFNVAKTLETLIHSLPDSPAKQELLNSSVLPALKALSGDVDPDVRFFADRAIHVVNEPADVTMADG